MKKKDQSSNDSPDVSETRPVTGNLEIHNAREAYRYIVKCLIKPDRKKCHDQTKVDTAEWENGNPKAKAGEI